MNLEAVCPDAMKTIAERLEEIRAALPGGVTLVAVSKYHPAAAVAEAYAAGQRVFGESRAQELLAKRETLPADIAWHFIGHLQPNKVKYIAPFVALIHAVDSGKLLREIEKQGARCGRVLDCLLQLHVAREESKFGFAPDDLKAFLATGEWKEMKHVRLCGLMCMASNTDDAAQVRGEFRLARRVFLEAKRAWFADEEAFRVCSWGMSGDYPIAAEEGSTMVRVGSAIFGERE